MTTTTNDGDGDARPDPRHERERRAALRQIENLVAANAESNETMVRLVDGVRHDSYMREKKIDLLEKGLKETHRVVIMVGVAIVIMVAIGVFNTLSIHQARANAAVTARAAKDANNTYALLLDCLNTQGQCGKRNAAQSQVLLDEIKKYELTVLYCARINPAVADPQGVAFLACVKRLYPGGPELNNK